MGGLHAGRAGICAYCGQQATETCQLCGAIVCGAHFNKSAGACANCLRGRQAK